MTFQLNTWKDGMQAFAAEADRQFGEPLSIIPMTRRPNLDAVRDTSRPIAEITGQFTYRAKDAWPGGGSGQRHDKHPLPVNSREPIMILSTCSLPYVIKAGDIVKRCNGSQYEVQTVEPDGTAQIEYKLLMMGVQSSLD
jgi:hypothetical protein